MQEDFWCKGTAKSPFMKIYSTNGLFLSAKRDLHGKMERKSHFYFALCLVICTSDFVEGSFSRFRLVKAAKPSATSWKCMKMGKSFPFSCISNNLIVPLPPQLDCDDKKKDYETHYSICITPRISPPVE